MTKTNSTWKKIKVQTLYKGIRMNRNMQEASQDMVYAVELAPKWSRDWTVKNHGYGDSSKFTLAYHLMGFQKLMGS